MIKFFRKIRQKLLAENKFSYAVGEIFLVMVGILLAFQVNQINENIKSNELQSDILRQVNISLESDLEDVIFNINRESEIGESQDRFIKWIESEEVYKDSLSIDIYNSHTSVN